MLTELSRREKEANIKPDPDIDIYMKARYERNKEYFRTIFVQKHFFTDLKCFGDYAGGSSRRAGSKCSYRLYSQGISLLKFNLEIRMFLTVFIYVQILGLEICADTLVGDEMLRGISGGQKKRLTTGKERELRIFLTINASLFFFIFNHYIQSQIKTMSTF